MPQKLTIAFTFDVQTWLNTFGYVLIPFHLNLPLFRGEGKGGTERRSRIQQTVEQEESHMETKSN